MMMMKVGKKLKKPVRTLDFGTMYWGFPQYGQVTLLVSFNVFETIVFHCHFRPQFSQFGMVPPPSILIVCWQVAGKVRPYNEKQDCQAQ